MQSNTIIARNIAASLLAVIAVLLAPELRAGDEDMSPSAYHVFDPETGYMMTIDPMAEEQIVDAGDDATAETTASAAAETSDGKADRLAKARQWSYLAALILIIGGLIVWIRKKDRIA